MIKVSRVPLPAEVAHRMAALTREIDRMAPPDRKRRADLAWKRSSTRQHVTRPIRVALARMAVARECCMYCGESLGTSIDHHEPVNRNPLRTFDWLNHLLACSSCNSNYKRDIYPVDADGRPLLIDPSVEDPFRHLGLTLATGEYQALTDKGGATIEVFKLNRPLLARGRLHARLVIGTAVRQWCLGRDTGDPALAREAEAIIREQPFADVAQTMFRYALQPGARVIFQDSPGLALLLRRPDLRSALLT